VLSLMLLKVFLIMESTLFLMADSKSGNKDNDSLPSLILPNDLELLILSFFGLLLTVFPVEFSLDVVVLLLW